MKTIKLGRTGLEVSRIRMGGLPIQRPPEDEAIRVIQWCLDLGVTFIDTARSYGASEERIGKAITGRRDQIVIATKTGYRDKATALKELELSLHHLQTDYIDLWQLHSISTFKSYEQVLGPEGVLEAAQEALKANKVRHENDLLRKKKETTFRKQPSISQTFLRLLDKASQEKLRKICQNYE
jgi:aryl-alcohol dehydrogenase-like predicted oxidoreductase